jgi:hypothetical protein
MGSVNRYGTNMLYTRTYFSFTGLLVLEFVMRLIRRAISAYATPLDDGANQSSV